MERPTGGAHSHRMLNFRTDFIGELRALGVTTQVLSSPLKTQRPLQYSTHNITSKIAVVIGFKEIICIHLPLS